ncbi:small multidrug resistance pump [Actinoplanes octamycinicus]|uniref:Small multidrug resistance pump n=1 Tax=Actinoplanes octamycinicus TaxID=135948 RepID=A0A7W7GYZ7_9ACTN|nr:multidrug efflux SMR transporter [Actinoplanes octamycinicus]MBB4740901.1 small multidrug resistance pump [Actinoplanes octamycinicus]GIE55808.1 multidrug resistance protein mmr [Actinoplanes octamycinicus]
MPYVLLALAIGSELFATSMMKATDGFSRLWPTLAVLAGYAISFTALSHAIKGGIQVGIAYAIWSAVGTAAIVVIGALFLDEPVTLVKVGGIVLIIAGVVMLNLTGAEAH